MDSLPSDLPLTHRTASRVARLLAVCKIFAITTVGLGLVAEQTGPAGPFRAAATALITAGLVVLLVTPFAALVAIAAEVRHARPRVAVLAVGAIAVATAGIWLAR